MREWIVPDEDIGVDGAYYGYQELLRCKDCKYYLKSAEVCQLINTRLHFFAEEKKWSNDSYCSWARRKVK